MLLIKIDKYDDGNVYTLHSKIFIFHNLLSNVVALYSKEMFFFTSIDIFMNFLSFTLYIYILFFSMYNTYFYSVNAKEFTLEHKKNYSIMEF